MAFKRQLRVSSRLEKYATRSRARLAFVACFFVVLFAKKAAATEDCAPYRVAWSFRTASPISPPLAVDSAGQTYLATHEGYLHGLGVDGRFLWSYTVKGALLHGVVVDDQRRVYTASSDGILYALNPSGQARWVYEPPVAPRAGLRVTENYALHFHAGYYLYAVSSRAGLLWRAPLGSRAHGDLVGGPDDATWLLTRKGELHAIQTPYRHRHWPAKGGLGSSLIAVTEQLALLLVDDRLEAIDRNGETRFGLDGVFRAAVDTLVASETLAVIGPARIEFRRVTDGQLLAQLPYAHPVAAAPLLFGERLFVPRTDGVLDVVAPSGVTHSCRVADSALLEPRAAPGSRQVIVAAGSGVVSGLALPAASDLPPASSARR